MQIPDLSGQDQSLFLAVRHLVEVPEKKVVSAEARQGSGLSLDVPQFPKDRQGASMQIFCLIELTPVPVNMRQS
jgi:hypothetical protein